MVTIENGEEGGVQGESFLAALQAAQVFKVLELDDGRHCFEECAESWYSANLTAEQVLRLADELIALAGGRAGDSSATGWQPIGTAPVDGTEVLVCRAYENKRAEYSVAHNYADGSGWRDMGDMGWAGMVADEQNQPTHWMPLPPPHGAAVDPPVAEKLKAVTSLLQEFVDFLEPMRFDRPKDDARAAALDKKAREILGA